MKRVLHLILLTLLFLATFACGKENAVGGGNNEVKPAPGQEDAPDEPLQPGQFRAIGPSDVDVVDVAGTKAYPSWSQEESALFRVRWRNDDRIRIWYDRSGSSSGEYSVIAGGGTETATLSLVKGEGDADDETGTYYAVYPASGAVSISGTTFTVTLPDDQTDPWTGTSNIDESAQVMIAKCGPERILNFKQVCTFIRLGLRYVIPGFYCNQVVISSENSYLAGHLAIKYSGVNPVVTGIVEDAAASHSVTLHISSTTFTDSGSGISNYAYLYVAPGTYDDLTFTFTMVDGKGNSYTVTKAAPESITFVRSTYRQINFTLATNLSADETANCYTVKTPGVYYFDASKRGNAEETSVGLSGSISEDLASVAQYYSDGPNSVVNGVYQTDGDGATFIDRLGATNGGYFLNAANKRVFFKTQSSLTSGTSLVSVKDASNNTLWSWHIWCNTALADVAFTSGHDSKTRTYMNMNLGAHKVGFNPDGFNGYYYQWGRKDPIQQALGVNNILDVPFVTHASQTDGSLANSIAYPLNFYGSYYYNSQRIADWAGYDPYTPYYDWWCKGLTSSDVAADGASVIPASDVTFKKTMFDPCPPGYHVPTFYGMIAFRNTTISSVADSKNNGYIDAKDGSNRILRFPCTGMRGAGISKANWGTQLSGISADDWKPNSYMWSCVPAAAPDCHTAHVPRFWIIGSNSGSTTDSGTVRALGCIVRCQKD